MSEKRNMFRLVPVGRTWTPPNPFIEPEHPAVKGERLRSGSYVAQITDSWMIGSEVLALRLACRCKWGVEDAVIWFHIHHTDLEAQWRARSLLWSVTCAVGLDYLDDSDQLHGIPFMLTVWRAEPLRFSCRPVSDAKNGNVQKCPASVVLRGVSDDEGPQAA
jgi:hypothetical protein